MMMSDVGRNSEVKLVSYDSPVEGILFQMSDKQSVRLLMDKLEQKAGAIGGDNETFEVTNGDTKIYLQYVAKEGLYVGARLR